MLKGIQISGSKNKALINSIWALDDDTHDIYCLSGFKDVNKYKHLRELGLVDFNEVQVDLENFANLTRQDNVISEIFN